MPAPINRQLGFTLVELMVAIVIGAVISLAAATAMVTFSASQRRDVGEDAAIENAAVVLFSLAHEVKDSGVSPIDFNGALVCTNFNVSINNVTVLDNVPVFPVVITDGGAGSDQLTVAYGNSILGRSGTRLITDMSAPNADLIVASGAGFNAGDVITVGTSGAGTPCTVMQVSASSAVASNADFAHAATGTLTYNPANPAAAFTTAPAYPAGSLVFGAGGFSDITYKVAPNGLQMIDNLAAAAGPNVISDNVVYLKAQYGTTTALGQPTVWVSASAAPSPMTAAFAAQVTAIHVGIVVRNSQHLQPTVHGGACDATLPTQYVRTLWTNNPAGVNDPTVNLSTLLAPSNPQWACYKYRTFDLVIPLKNVLF
jgi:type IV pilus assembly protein PilW